MPLSLFLVETVKWEWEKILRIGWGEEGSFGGKESLQGKSGIFPDKLAVRGMCSCASAVPLRQVEELASRGAVGDIF